MARICIVTSSALGSNPRVVKEADALAARGHQVHVVSARVLDLVEARDQDILATAAWTSERIDVRRSFRRKVARLLQLPLRWLSRHLPHPMTGAYDLATGPLAACASRWPADLYIAHYVPALPAAALAARRHGARYAFDAEDFHLGDLPDEPGHAFEKKMIRAIEARYLPACAYVTAASPGIADAYAKTYDIPVPAVVLNVFPLAHAPEGPTSKGTAEPGPSLYWFSQTIGPERGLEDAVRAIGLARTRPHLHLRGLLAHGFRETLDGIAQTSGAAGRVHYYPPAAPSELERLGAAYDAGLAVETGQTPNRRIALTNKQFSYMLGGLAVLMSDIPAHRDFADQAEGAVTLFRSGDPSDLARAIDEVLGDPARLAAARGSAYALGQSVFNWDREQAVLVRTVEGALTQPRARP